MRQFLGLMILLSNISAFAVDGVVDTTATEKQLHDYIYNQLSMRVGRPLTKKDLDPKETDFTVSRDVREETVADKSSLTAEQTTSTSDGNLVIKPDIVQQVRVDGIYFFKPSAAPKEGLACNIGADIAVSTVYKNPTTCSISVQCTWIDGSADDINYALKRTDCGTFTQKADERSETQDGHAARVGQ